jgi:hypothetical protein
MSSLGSAFWKKNTVKNALAYYNAG